MIDNETRTGVSSSTTIMALPNGETRMSSNDPLYRYLRAAADLFIAGSMDADELVSIELRWSMDGRQDREIACPAARRLLELIVVALMEPSCICIANWDGPPCIRGCVPMDRRERLRELIGD